MFTLSCWDLCFCFQRPTLFIRPKSDHCLALSVSHSLLVFETWLMWPLSVKVFIRPKSVHCLALSVNKSVSALFWDLTHVTLACEDHATLQNSRILSLCVNHHPLVQKLFYFLVWSNSSNSVFTQARESWEDGACVLPLVISLEGRLCCILLLCFCCSVAMLMLCWCCAVAMPLHIACCKTKPTWSLHNTCHRCNMELSKFKHGIVTWICQSC